MDGTRMHIVNNIFLPRKLPQKETPSRGEFVREFAEFLADDVVRFHALKAAEQMMKVWSQVQGASVTWESVHDAINALRPGETFPLYLPAQNAGLTIFINDEPERDPPSASLAVFRVSARAGEIMQAGGDLYDVFPSWAVTTNAERVRNESFAIQVADLANSLFTETLPKSRKGGTEVPETRDVADPSYVTAWLLLAVAGESLITGERGVARVRKKICDDVLWDNAKRPWRRSGEYMAIKFVLQSTLVGNLGEHEGLISYKYILIQVMTRIVRQNLMELDTDIVLQMISKLARRLSKLSTLMDRGAELLGTGPSIRPEIYLHVREVLNECCSMVFKTRSYIDKRWQGIVKGEEHHFQVLLDTSKLDFPKHVTQSLVNAGEHLKCALDSSVQPIPIQANNPICSNRNIGCSIDFAYLRNYESPMDSGQALYDIEVWVQKVLWPGRKHYVGKSCSQFFFKLFKDYLDLAKRYYKGDPLGSSRMVLSTITLVAILDYLAIRKYPMLCRYDHGVNVGVLQSLLLVHRADMKHLKTVEKYFATRSRSKKFDISLISEDQPSPDSFSVRFAQSNRRCQEIKDEILLVAAINELEKLEEVPRQRGIYKELMASASKESHDHFKYRQEHNPSSCTKCRMEQRARDMKVDIYERPLPEEAHLQNAVVYELATPSKLSVLRDALHVLNRDVLGIELQSTKRVYVWLDYEPLKPWISQKHKKMTTLCSTSKLFSQSHYSVQHPSVPDREFIKPNGFNVQLMEAGANHSLASTAYYRSAEVDFSFLTLSVDGVYKSLQWTITSTTHDENQVLARQRECPPILSLAEFKAFGSLRAGHRLQIRNISRVLEMQSLSLFQPSVVNLFSQALWQAGPPAPNDRRHKIWVRESHLDLQEQLFAEYMIQQLRYLLERNKENWKDHLGLLSIVMIGARILELSEYAWQEAACSILLSCRAVAEIWLEKVEKVLGAMSASSIQNITKIRSKLVDVAAIAALTFDVGVRHLKLIVKRDADVTSWLRAIARLHDINTLLNSEPSSSETFDSTFQRNLLRRVQNSALRLEKALDKRVANSDCLSIFVAQHWADADQGQIGCWKRYESPCERWWMATYEHKSGRKMTLQMDILRGSFLVDGSPVARLPTTITAHRDYGRVFGKHVFQVQPAAGSPESFVTSYKVNGSIFTFALVDVNRLLVVERRSDGCELELFPSRLFQGDLPQLLIEGYSHWILKASNFMQNVELRRFKHMDPDETLGCILFRPLKFDDSGFADIEGVPFVLNIRSRHVRDTKMDRNLVDVRSSSFKEIHGRVLHRLELPQFVHVFDNKNDNSVAAELPRMGLRFNVDPKAGVVWSCEHPGFSVSKSHNIGTLIGLRNCLLLEEHVDLSTHCTPKQSVIVPFGALNRRMVDCGTVSTQAHPVVEVDLSEFSSPSFFVFEVDHRLRNLRGPASGPTAWLYLALLHASTSHMLPDPLTGLTGTESAMRLLQSPRCWSCMPYKREAVSILRAIAELSPTRKWYPKHLQCMQQVTWPKALFSCTALDAFQLVVRKLMSDSNRLRFLFPSSDEVPVLPKGNSTLLLKYYWRSREAFGKEARMDSTYEKHLGEPPALSSVSMNLSSEEHERFRKHGFLRSLAEAGHEWRSLAVSQGENLLSGLLLNCRNLNGASAGEIKLRDSTVSTWSTMGGDTFTQTFLGLYNLAREVKQRNDREHFTLLLSVLAYLSVDPLALSILHCVAVHPAEFIHVTPPEYAAFEFTNEAKFNKDMVEAAVIGNLVSFDKWMSKNGENPRYYESEADFNQRLQTSFDQSQAQSVKMITETAQKCWPSDVTDFSNQPSTVNSHSAAREINKLFTRWRHNKELHIFVANVEKKVVDLCDHQVGVARGSAPLEGPIRPIRPATIQPFHLDMPVSPLSDSLAADADKIFGTCHSQTAISDDQPAKKSRNWDEPPTFPLQQDASLPGTCEVARKFNMDLETSWREHLSIQPRPPRVVVKEQLADKLRAYKEQSKSLWKKIYDAVQPCDSDRLSQALEAAGLWRRALPVVLLPCIMSGDRDDDNTVDMNILSNVRVALGDLAVVWTLEQQVERCLRMLQVTKSANRDVALQKELANTGHQNWLPKKWPKWLILELEGDYLMRAIQVHVAMRMLFPQGCKNAVLQLNMGEGKTSVIVPAICASISDGDRFARITVLGSLFRMNFDALVSKLGGLLNQRVYTFPFRRDMSIDADGVQTMCEVYRECIARRGVVVMRPEHRLSTILKGLELCRYGTPSAGLAIAMRNLQLMVEMKARDILDESDLLLDVKYQVVYTVGHQMNIDGGDLRWKVSQSVLRSAQCHISALLDKHGAEKIELGVAPEGPYAFPHIRILDASIGAELCAKIAEDILAGGDDNLPLRELRRNDAALIRSFILPPADQTYDFQSPSIASIKMIYNEGPILETILILRGLLGYGVLIHALQMRWRVQYGVRPSNIPKMAVPFRAKDVPVERAEFGHPDLAIVLTQLSYYHGGLSNAQLLEAFDRLHRTSTSENEYQRWLRGVPMETLPPTLHKLSGVNLDDFVQRTEVLFPVLRRNMRVINFWLSTVVFPVEAKMFAGKLVSSAWDLSDCSKGGHPVSGFSGTRDTSLLLPSSIAQDDLPELQSTDGAVIAKLLQEENTFYASFPSCISSLEILKQSVVAKHARVLLDVGALMVDMSNRNVAIEWLKQLTDRTNIQAAIYFDDENRLMSIDRDERSAPLALSPFHRQMDRCVVYLDDVHTRGTDLKIPQDSHACVTLGRGITKDRLVQACMRMRMLGEGHSVSFWASQEVHTSIQQISSLKPNPTSIDVLHWVIRNTVSAIKDGFRHWGSQGIAHARKKVVSHMFEAKQGVTSLLELGRLCTDAEVTGLATSYGCDRRETLLHGIMESRLRSAAKDMEAQIGHGAGVMVEEQGLPVTDRIEKYAAGVKCFSQGLDEEQERELEHELEEEEEVERPGAATPHKPSLSQSVQSLASHGSFNPDSSDFLPLMKAFERSDLWNFAEPRAWSDKLWVTRDFATVLEEDSVSSGTPFLRPVAWCAVVLEGGDSVQHIKRFVGWTSNFSPKAIVLLSPFEANELLPAFRRGGGAQLHMIAPRIHQVQNLMLCERPLTLPIRGRSHEARFHDSHIAQLLAFSGSAYFANACEQDAYCEFLCLRPRPRSAIDDVAFQSGDIQLDGFFRPDKRKQVSEIEASARVFQRSPVQFMSKLLCARGWTGHAAASHVGQILCIGERAQIGTN